MSESQKRISWIKHYIALPTSPPFITLVSFHRGLPWMVYGFQSKSSKLFLCKSVQSEYVTERSPLLPKWWWYKVLKNPHVLQEIITWERMLYYITKLFKWAIQSQLYLYKTRAMVACSEIRSRLYTTSVSVLGGTRHQMATEWGSAQNTGRNTILSCHL